MESSRRLIAPSCLAVLLALAGNAAAESALRPDGPPLPSCTCDDECANQGYGVCHRGVCNKNTVEGTPCAPCTAPLQACDGGCFDLAHDDRHCGACGNACDSTRGLACVDGACGCPAATTSCGGECVLTDADPRHCGGCGNACITDQYCDKGACRCPRDRCNGKCVSLMIDAEHCGTCGTACAAGDYCNDGVCVALPGNDDGGCALVPAAPLWWLPALLLLGAWRVGARSTR
jgi:hypothetical protein